MIDGQLLIFDVLPAHETISASAIEKPENVATEEVNEQEPKPLEDSDSGFDFDIMAKFDAVKIGGNMLISDEDKEFCEQHQIRIDAAVALILKAKQFYVDNEMSNIFLSTKNLIKDLDEKLTSKIDSFVSKIVTHFRTTYSVTINREKFRKYDHTITYKDVVDDILLQMDGMNFSEKANEEIKEAVRNTIYNSSKVKVQSLKVAIADYLYFESWFSGSWLNKRDENLAKLLRGVELFESGKTTTRDTLAIIANDRIRKDWFDEFSFTFMNKFESLKCFKNGKVELKFKSHELALQFAKEYLKYT
ncbi:hypothetical protein EHV15_34145 [Paenibacillus oralis]|uniref:DUF4942 domain-containing protein n=1 Tax=Paenibacillus oralis TaxID=2490856 RepID=A0A3P3T9G0_9BACL|nr:hypothetical protein [Paenibacillus oralis]RRJ54640.1 hypothetical protein EHV15_34145 [Paenibacillus oralis]